MTFDASYTSPPLLDDLPIKSCNDDVLGFSSMAKKLAHSILKQAGPYVLHIDGGWGSGKTSFCRLLKEQLEELDQTMQQPSTNKADHPSPEQNDTLGITAKNEYPSRILWTEFIATQFEQTDAPGQALLLFMTDRVLSADSETSVNGYSLLTDPVRAHDQLESLCCAFRANGINSDVNQIGSLGRFEEWLAKALTKNDAKPMIEDAENKEIAAPRKLVVLIDDLDRCLPEFAADLLRVIQRFVTCEHLCFLISADRTVLKQAYSKRFERILCDGLTPEKALQKYIRTTYTLPSFTKSNPTRIASSVYKAQTNYTEFFRTEIDGKWEQDLRPILLRTLGNTVTPRAYKRILNKLVLLLAPSDMALTDMTLPVDALRDLTNRRSIAVFHAAMAQLWPEVEGELAETSESAINEFVKRLVERPYLEICEKANFTTHDWEGISARLFDLPPPPLNILVALRQLAKSLRPWSYLRTTAGDESGYRVGANLEEMILIEPVLEKVLQEEYLQGDPDKKTLDRKVDVESDPTLVDSLPPLDVDAGKPINTLKEAQSRLNILELLIDAGVDKSEITGQYLAEVWDLIEKFDDGLSPPLIGNLAVSAETEGFPDIAWRIHSHQRDRGKFDTDFRLVRQYVSFLIDLKDEKLSSPDPRAQTDAPKEAARYWLTRFPKESLPAKEKQMHETLEYQLAAKTGQPLDFGAMAASLLATPTMSGAVFLLRCAGENKEVQQQVVDAVLHVIGHSAVEANKKQQLQRALGDYLATDAAGRPEYREQAKNLYWSLQGTTLWDPDTKHNLATLIYSDGDDESKAEGLWREAYLEASTNAPIQRGLAQLLKRSKRPDLALRVARGEPL
ncbi:MAG: P-loop NTPase fold protein [Rhodoferax sp.]|nr:P-loop NTPase fold protein [Rhodoferax sp.]MDP3652145.1 P-loop NTPase fold protein [Rhodoferax sp.]